MTNENDTTPDESASPPRFIHAEFRIDPQTGVPQITLTIQNVSPIETWGLCAELERRADLAWSESMMAQAAAQAHPEHGKILLADHLPRRRN